MNIFLSFNVAKKFIYEKIKTNFSLEIFLKNENMKGEWGFGGKEKVSEKATF